MEAQELSSGLPPPDVLMAPASELARMPILPPHPNVAKFNAGVTVLLKMLEKIASAPVSLNVTPVPGEYEKSETAMAILDALRSSVALLNGTRARILEREIASFLPHLAPKYISVRQRALVQMNEMRAALAFFLDEDDAEKLGYEFVPPAPPASGESAPSIVPDLG